MRVLIVEDYPPLRKAVSQGLTEAGYAVDAVGDGRSALERAGAQDYDVIILDLLLPEIDGLQVLRSLRAAGNGASVLILTAKDTVPDRVHGLNLGADDYLVKPFAFQELLARVSALTRRKWSLRSPVVRVGNLTVNTAARRVERGGREVELSFTEYAILETLAVRAGQVVTRSEILEHIYSLMTGPGSNVIDVYIGYLRKKTEEGGWPRLIHTRRGLGYVLEDKT